MLINIRQTRRRRCRWLRSGKNDQIGGRLTTSTGRSSSTGAATTNNSAVNRRRVIRCGRGGIRRRGGHLVSAAHKHDTRPLEEPEPEAVATRDEAAVEEERDRYEADEQRHDCEHCRRRFVRQSRCRLVVRCHVLEPIATWHCVISRRWIRVIAVRRCRWPLAAVRVEWEAPVHCAVRVRVAF